MAEAEPKTAGQPFRPSASEWNFMLDAAKRSKMQGGMIRNVFAPSASSLQQILIRNDSGADRDIGEILKLSEPIFTPSDDLEQFRHRVHFKGIAPTADCHHAILVGPIADGKMGLAWTAPIIAAQIDVDDVADTTAGVDTGYQLVTGLTGWDIVWKESGTGSGKWAYLTPTVLSCATLAALFGVPDTKPPTVNYWVPAFDKDTETTCVLKEVLTCEEESPAVLTFETYAELIAAIDPTGYTSGTLFAYVTTGDDLGIYMVSGTPGELADTWEKV